MRSHSSATIAQLLAEYAQRKPELERRWQSAKGPITRDEAFAIFVKCILSSKTKWEKVVSVVNRMQKSELLYTGTVSQVLDYVRKIGGKVDHEARARWIIEDREPFLFVWSIVDSVRRGEIALSPNGLQPNELSKQYDGQSFLMSLGRHGLTPEALRVAVMLKGAGYKQASHFLTSLGLEGYAVIDTHVQNKLVQYGVIQQKPKTLTRAQYLQIENALKSWCATIGISLHFLDMLWFESEANCL